MLYPLVFKPILKDKIWGGSKLKKSFSKEDATGQTGESWELSGYEGDESVVLNGFLAGNNLTELIEVYMGELVGDKIYDKFGLSFPLLFKLIDANDKLSIQVHPGDEIAAERHNSYGKTEMWYVMDAEPGAELIIGFGSDCSREEYLNALETDRVENLLQRVAVTKGDVFFIPAGLVHAIGKGVVIAEIQQSSDITYRIFDYNRKDDNGIERELHTADALDVIDFSASASPKTDYSINKNKPVSLVRCDYFTTNLLSFDLPLSRNYAALDSFVALMSVDGDFIVDSGDDSIPVSKGQTILIPACFDAITLIPQNECTVLEVYIDSI